MIKYYDNGNKKSEEYYLNDKRHNDNGPAYIKYYENSKVDYEIYYHNGLLHNDKGPAIIQYYDNGKIELEEYRIHGIKLSKVQYEYVLQFPKDDWLNVIEIHYGS